MVVYTLFLTAVFRLIGGRRIQAVDRYDPLSNTWQAMATPPLELHHFQAVSMEDGIYLMGAMTGKYPGETPIERVLVFRPEQNTFEYHHTIPKERRRGGAGTVAHKGKIYLVGGIVDGHRKGYQPWLDEYNPSTGEWRVLPDAPHARDHFAAVITNNILYAISGRTTSQSTKQTFELTITQSDAFDLQNERWLPNGSTPNIPTPRAGTMANGVAHYTVIAGGESGSQKIAHNEVEALNTLTNKWETWPSLETGRHGTGLIYFNDALYVVAGSGNRGGSPELNTLERMQLTPR